MGVQIDWATAEVHDGKLVVELDAKPTPAWRKGFRATLDRIERTGEHWGTITTAKQHIAVTAVEPRAADDLRHLLEGAVQQANADEASADQHEADGPDAELTAAFRGFAG